MKQSNAILAIDPGPEHSAYAVLRDGQPVEFAKLPNDEMRTVAQQRLHSTDVCVIEQIKSYGMSVGAEIFETCFWSGIFAEAYGLARVERVPRLKVKLHLCGSPRAKDGNVRQALIDMYGGKDRAIGSKKAPGPLYGMAGDCWAALAVAVTFAARGSEVAV